MDLSVESRPGFGDEPEPVAFLLGERRLVVREVVDRWFAPGQRWVRVDADDGDTYVLRHDGRTGRWELAAFTRGGR
jgi:hypothetical protein